MVRRAAKSAYSAFFGIVIVLRPYCAHAKGISYPGVMAANVFLRMKRPCNGPIEEVGVMAKSMMVQTVRLKKLILWVAIPLIVGGISSLLSGDMGQMWNTLRRPPLSPPGWVFPIVWTVLYVFMGVAAYLVSESSSTLRPIALRLYWLQLLLNFLWSPIFFGCNMPGLALVIAIALWAVLGFTVLVFARVDRLAGLLMLPVLLWVTFAVYLNAGIVALN